MPEKLEGSQPEDQAPRFRIQHADLVAELGTRIVGGSYEVGQVLPREEELVGEFSVSRSVVREAMRVLASKGLVQAKPKRGTMVLPPQNWQHLDPDVLAWRVSQGTTAKLLSDLFDLRAMIEPAACALAAERATDTELALIASLSREMAHAAADEKEFIEADMRFHGALLSAAHNDLLNQVGAAIETAMRLSREVTVSMAHSSRLPEHAEVAAAVTARSASRARRAMANLIQHGAADIDKAFSGESDAGIG
jgi:GntR family galactonate operon transcriptional repressor